MHCRIRLAHLVVAPGLAMLAGPANSLSVNNVKSVGQKHFQ